MTRSFVKMGVPILADMAFLSMSFEGRGTYLLLLLLSALSEGRMTPESATVLLRNQGCADPGPVVAELVLNGMIADGMLSGWEKYQDDYHKWNTGRATTREGRRLGLTREQEEARGQSSTLDTSTVETVHNDTDATRVDTVETVHRGVPSPLISSPSDGDTTEEGTTQKTARFSPGDDSDRDIQDTLYELTFLRPWGKEWGQRALALVGEFGSDADPTMRQIAAEKPGTKPWDLVRLTADVLERDRDRAKSRERHEAGKHRAARANGAETGRITLEEYERLAKTYKEPVKNDG